MSAYSEFFLNSRSSVVQLELLQISHPDFSKDYRIVRNSVNGVTVQGLGAYGKNLFNPADADVALGYYVNFASGGLIVNAAYNTTGFVPVLPGQTYTISYSHMRAFYDRNKAYVSGQNSGSPGTFVVPDGCYYVRLTVLTTSWSTFQIEQGLVLTAASPFGVASFEYYPLRIENTGARDDLDQSFNFTLGDLGKVLPMELDRVAQGDGFGFRPVVVYHTYRSDVLTSPLFGPVLLEVESFAFNRDGCAFTAKAPSLNINKTGELYSLERFPMLRGFL